MTGQAQSAGPDGHPEPHGRSRAGARSRGVIAIRVRVVVTGRVQGVWFRDTCRDMAKVAGVHGFVRNRADGAVEAEFEGPEAAVERMIAWCRIGPARARVENVEVDLVDPVGAPSFRIR